MSSGAGRVLYEKVGRRYKPVAEDVQWDCLAEGDYLVCVRPGSRSCHHLLEPDHAAVLAAMYEANDAMCRAMVRAAEARPQTRMYTAKEKRAWEAYKKIAGKDATLTLTIPCAADVVDAGVKVLCEILRDKAGK